MNCENCGMPQGAEGREGISVTVTRRAENGFDRNRKIAVWCHCDECAVQALAISKYGPATYRWPITLAQFRATKPLATYKQEKQGSSATIEASVRQKAAERQQIAV